MRTRARLQTKAVVQAVVMNGGVVMVMGWARIVWGVVFPRLLELPVGADADDAVIADNPDDLTSVGVADAAVSMSVAVDISNFIAAASFWTAPSLNKAISMYALSFKTPLLRRGLHVTYQTM